MRDHETSNNTSGLLSRLQPQDRERLGEALRRLMAHGSILGLEPAQTDLYHWCYQNRPWVDEFAGLLDLKLHWEHQDRMVQAVPKSAAFLLRLKLDATLVLLTLWYEFDTAIRDRGETPPVRDPLAGPAQESVAFFGGQRAGALDHRDFSNPQTGHTIPKHRRMEQERRAVFGGGQGSKRECSRNRR